MADTLAKLVVEIGGSTKGLDDALDATEKKAGGFGSKVGSAIGGIGTIAGGIVAGGAIQKIGGFLMEAVQGAAADEQATARLSQALRNLGGDFDENLAKVNDAIDRGQKLAFSDDDVRDSFQSLAAATGDTDEALKRQAVAMDLARGANIPLGTATKMLGKLNEENIEIFKKLGITIGEGATEADVLAAAQAKFGDQSEAYAKSTAGQFEQAKLAMGEIQESIGSALLPVLTKLGTFAAEQLPKVQAFIGGMAEGFQGLMNNASPLLGLLAPIGDALGTLFTLITTHKEALIGLGVGVAAVVVPAFVAWAVAAGAAAAATVIAAAPVIALVAGVALLATGIVLLVTHWDDVTAALGRTGAGLTIVKDAIGNFFTDVLPDVGSKLADLGGKFASWVADAVPPMIAALGGLVVDLGTAVVDAAPGIAAKLLEWGLAFAGWVAEAVPPLLLELGKLWVAVHLWVAEQAIALAGKLLEWGLAFIGWIGPQIPGMLLELGKLWIGVQVWIVQKIVDLHVELAKWGLAFIEWIALDVLPKLPGALADIITAIGGWVGGAIGTVRGKLGDIGGAMIDGIKAGIQGAMGAILSYAEGIAGDIVKAIKDRLKVFSPSQVTRDEVGIPLITGIQAGMAAQLPAAIAQAEAAGAAIAAGAAEGYQHITGKAGVNFGVGPTSQVPMPGGPGLVTDVLNGTGAGGFGPGGIPLFVMPTGGFAQMSQSALGGPWGAGNVSYSQNPFYDPNYTTPFTPVAPAGNAEAEQAAATQAELTGAAVAASLAGMSLVLDINGEQVFARFVDGRIGKAMMAGVG